MTEAIVVRASVIGIVALIALWIFLRLRRMGRYERKIKEYLGADAEKFYNETTMIYCYDNNISAAYAAREMRARRSYA
jgi:hypothetical protein